MKLSPLIRTTFALYIASLALNPLMGVAQTGKRLTNDDVVKLFQSGLAEDTIVLSIKNTPGNFDTTPDGLIQLKNAGVPQAIINAMVEAQAQAQPAETTNIGTNDDSQGNRINISLSAVRMITDSDEFVMKRRRPDTRSNSGLLRLVTGFGQSKRKAIISGPKANLRISDANPEFELALPFDVDPVDYFVLVELKQKKDRREVETGREGLSANLGEGQRVKDGFREKIKVPITYKEMQTVNGTTTYLGTLDTPLEAGKEYALVYQQFFYDFGVDS